MYLLSNEVINIHKCGLSVQTFVLIFIYLFVYHCRHKFFFLHILYNDLRSYYCKLNIVYYSNPANLMLSLHILCAKL